MTTITESLAKYLNVDTKDIKPPEYNEDVYIYGEKEYYVLTDEEANEKTAVYIKDSLWAFNSGFIIDHIENCEDRAALEESIKLIQEKQCENANAVIYNLIRGEDGIIPFIEDAIAADGRGHFLATYDGKEGKEGKYYIYRLN